jgi:exosortase
MSSQATAPVHEVEPQSSAPRFALVVPILITSAVCLATYAPVLYKLAHDWWILPDFSHGFVVPLFSAYIIYEQRNQLACVPLKASWGGVILLAAAMFLLIAGQIGAELFISRFSLVLTIAALVVLFAGWQMFRAIWFPWAFLFLMIPIPTIIFNQVTFPLQLVASKFAAAVLPLLNVPVLREGNIINIPAMPLEVAEACSGIRSLMTLGTLALMYSYFAEEVTWRRVVLVAASVPIAVVANASRVIGTGLCVQYWEPDKALGFFHEFSGWAIFMLSLVLLYIVHLGLRLLGRQRV